MWERIVYGDSKALPLATMLALWQPMSDRGWTDGGWAHVDSSTKV